MLLDAGADPNGYPDGATTYVWPPMRVLLPFLRRAALASRHPSDFADMFALADGSSPLHIACIKGNLGAVRLLLERGARLDSPNCGPKKRMTPLMYAALRGHLELVKELLAAAPAGGLHASALVAQKDARGKTAEHYACLLYTSPSPRDS